MKKSFIVSVLAIFVASVFVVIGGQGNVSDLPSLSVDTLDTTSYCHTHYPAGPKTS